MSAIDVIAQIAPNMVQKDEDGNTMPRLIKTQKNSEKILDALAQLGYTFRLNDCDDTIEVNGAAMDDITEGCIFTDMHDLGFKSTPVISNAIRKAAGNNRYNPIKNYLNALEWDGGDHIHKLTTYIRTSPTESPIIPDTGEARRLVHVYLLRWLVGAVAKALDGHQNNVLVFAGPQDKGKSYLAEWLCSGLPKRYYSEGMIAPNDKDCRLQQTTTFIWQVAEIGATTRRADVEQLKAFLTQSTIKERKSYGRHAITKPPMVSFIGTVNPENTGFLMDTTGNRRFYITQVTDIDWNYSQKILVDQVWAQAVALYRAGEAWRLSEDEKAVQTETNKAYEVETPLAGWVAQYFDCEADKSEKLTTSEVIEHLQLKGVNISTNNIIQAGREVSRAMHQLGVEASNKVRVNGTNQYTRGYAGIAKR